MIVVGLLLFFVVISVFTSNSYEDAAQSGFDISNFNEGWTFVYQGQRQIDFYESLWEGKPSIYADYRQTKEKVFSLRRYIGSHIGKKVLSHIDPVADNFLIIGTGDKEDIRLIDWEYSGMQDPHVERSFVMKSEVLSYVAEKSKELMEASTCSKEAKAAAKAWLEAVGTDQEARETEKYIAELEADIVTAEGLLAFASSDGGKQVFGEHAAQVADHARELVASGAKYCDCPACSIAAEILEKKDQMLS